MQTYVTVSGVLRSMVGCAVSPRPAHGAKPLPVLNNATCACSTLQGNACCAVRPRFVQGVNSQRGTLPWCGGWAVEFLAHAPVHEGMRMRDKAHHSMLQHRHVLCNIYIYMPRLMESCHLLVGRTAPEIIRTPDAVTEKIDVFR